MNFDQYIDRRGTDCKKYSPNFVSSDILPMWIADTDFSCPKEVLNVINMRREHVCLGYPYNLSEFNEVFKKWLKKRHDWDVGLEDIVFANGVIPAVTYFIQEFSNKGDIVVVNTPVYPPLQDAVIDNGRQLVKSSFIIGEQGEYKINFEELEKLFSLGKTKIFLLCNPHNPVGKVYTEEELFRIGKLCIKYGVLVFSDEIHSDIILTTQKKHIPFAKISEEFAKICCTGMNPGKAFNVSGVRTAAVIINNDILKNRFIFAQKRCKGMGRTIFGQHVFIACYKYGEQYLGELLDYLRMNYMIAKNYIDDNIPELEYSSMEGTYLMWLNFTKICRNHSLMNKVLIESGKIKLNDGITFGEEGKYHMRMNIAVPKFTLLEGLKRLSNAVNELKRVGD